MNLENSTYLKERVFFLGFGEQLHADMDKNMKAGKESFSLNYAGNFNNGAKTDAVDYTLNFSKSKTDDFYYLNNYKAQLKNENPELERSQTFYLNKGNGVTAKEAYNLLDGRSVFKKLENREGKPYNAWLQLNPQKEENGNHKVQMYHTAWGFDLEKNVSKIPANEIASPELKMGLIKSLEKGNIQAVTLLLAGKEERAFLQANPKERNIILYDAQMVRQDQSNRETKSVQLASPKAPDKEASKAETKADLQREVKPEKKSEQKRKTKISR